MSARSYANVTSAPMSTAMLADPLTLKLYDAQATLSLRPTASGKLLRNPRRTCCGGDVTIVVFEIEAVSAGSALHAHEPSTMDGAIHVSQPSNPHRLHAPGRFVIAMPPLNLVSPCCRSSTSAPRTGKRDATRTLQPSRACARREPRGHGTLCRGSRSSRAVEAPCLRGDELGHRWVTRRWHMVRRHWHIPALTPSVHDRPVAEPLVAHSDDAVPPLAAASYDPARVFYFGESAL